MMQLFNDISFKSNLIIFSFISGPFKNHPQVTVYHPNDGNGGTFANVGWSGWIGSIQGKAIGFVQPYFRITKL